MSAASTRKRPRKPRRAAELGVTPEEYDRLLADQDGKCAIHGCNRTPKTRRFHVDHDHATGYVRGLLCHWHNRIMPRDSTEALSLVAYLQLSEVVQHLGADDPQAKSLREQYLEELARR